MVSACGPVGKPHPTSAANSGSRFPPDPSTGNHIPFQRQIPGHGFRNPPIRKAHPTLDTFGYGIISHLLGLGSATWRPPGGVLLHEPHRMVRKEARVRLVAVLHLAIHPANAGDRIFQNRLIVRMMENVAPDACHGATLCQEKSLENFEAFTFVSFRARGDTPTRPARPFWRLQPCCPDLPWWGGPSRQPSCRAAS